MFLPYMKSARERLSHRLRSRGDLRRISAEAGLTHSWITKFLYGHINNPTIGNLGQLIRYLDATEGHTSCQPAPSPGFSRGGAVKQEPTEAIKAFRRDAVGIAVLQGGEDVNEH